MRRFLRAPEACARVGNPVLLDLIYGWGNEEWSALDEYLVACLAHAQKADGPILECGSGLSTILVGVIAQRRGLQHWALEHTPAWADKVRNALKHYRIDAVLLCLTRLKEYGEFCWYDAPLSSMPERFALVICDGPPGGTRGGRYGLVPVMRERLAPGCVVLLDDARREQERAIARRWEAELNSDCEVLGRAKPYIRMAIRC